MNKEMLVLDFYTMFANALENIDNVISDSKELYKIMSGFDYPDIPKIKDAKDVKKNQFILILRNDISNAGTSLVRCLEFVASTLNITFDELVNSEGFQTDFEKILIEVTEEETVYSANYIYDNLLDCYTYWYDLLETLDRITGIRFKNHLRKTFGKEKEQRLMELIYDLNEEADGYKNVSYFCQLIFDIICAFSGLEKVLNFFDELYGFDKGKAVREIGSYKTNYLPDIENKYLKITRL